MAGNDEPDSDGLLTELRPSSMSLKDYYESHSLSLDSIVSAKAPYRFIRLHPRFDDDETLDLVKKEIHECVVAGTPSSGPETLRAEDGIRAVPWLDERLKFYAVPASFNLSKSACFQQGRIYGQDASSGAAVAALLTTHFDDNVAASSPRSEVEALPPGDQPSRTLRVLDLCCCPGLKLCAMADFLRGQSSFAAVQLVGVDVSSSRMATCRRVVQKYQVDDASKDDANPMVHIQLYCQDGTQLGTEVNRASPKLVFDSRVAREQCKHLGKRKRQNKSSRARENRLLQNALREQCPTFEADSFDYVLVDAECSTDGSIRHVQQRLDKSNPVPDNPLVTDPKRLDDLNEGVVEWLLRENPDAKLVPVSVGCMSSSSKPHTRTVAINDRRGDCLASGRLPGTVQFAPRTEHREGIEEGVHNLYGDGFFLAKILKTIARTR